jgi:RNA polymerase sigma-70 factor (ECF subfamily)
MYDVQSLAPCDDAAPSSSSGYENDASFVSALLADDPGAWRAFHRVHAKGMLRVIGRVRSRFPKLLAADDVHEIYAELCLQLLHDDKKRLRRFDPHRGTPLAAWLGVLARHAAYDFLRERRRQPLPQGLGEDLGNLSCRADEAPDALVVACAREQAQLLSSLMEELSPRDREFVSLYFCEGLDPEETAERLGICVGTVYSKKHKIRARIEGLLEKRLAA